MDGPVVSVVIPVHNAARYLGETIGSVLAATEKRIEVLVVDDGSTDDTAAVAGEFARRDPRVTMIPRPRSGISRARNTGVLASRAPCLCFLDGDDLLHPTHFERQAAFLAGHPEAGVVYSPVRLFKDDDPAKSEPIQLPEDGGALAEDLLRGGVAFPLHCALVRRPWFDRVGGFDGRFTRNEDTFFWLRLVLAGCRYSFLPGPAVLYRRHSSAWSLDIERVIPDRLKLLDWLSRRGPVRNTARRDAVRSRRRFLTLVLARELAARGRRMAARAEALRSLRFGRRPGHVLEVARFLAVPRTDQPR